MPYDSFEWRQDPPPSNGVARSAWTRSHRRLSRWHRPYTAVLVVLDFVSAVLASWFAVTLLEQANSGFQDEPACQPLTSAPPSTKTIEFRLPERMRTIARICGNGAPGGG